MLKGNTIKNNMNLLSDNEINILAKYKRLSDSDKLKVEGYIDGKLD